MLSVMFALSALLAQLFFRGDAVPSFDINLDLAPEKRWVAVAKHYKDELAAMYPFIYTTIYTSLGETKMNEFLEHSDFDADHEAELKGFMDGVNHTNVSMKILKLSNLLYEMQSPLACSGVLWALPNGTVMHGRNMDYAFHWYMPDGRLLNWPDITFQASFYKNGRLLLTQTQWPGAIGLTTAMRPGGWSFQQNTRLSNSWKLNLAAAKKGGRPFGLVVRKIMESTSDFKTAVEKLYASKFMAPQYFVVSGAGAYEGAVLTIDRLGKHEAGTPPIQNVSNSSNWHLVQTNDDLLGLPADSRRPLANELLRLSKQEIGNTETLMQFMHTSQLLNPLTVYSVVMVPATGYFKTVLPTEPPVAISGEQHMYDTEPGVARAYGIGWLQQSAGVHVKALPPQLPKQNSLRKKKFLASRHEDEPLSFMQLSRKLHARRSTSRSVQKARIHSQTPIEEL